MLIICILNKDHTVDFAMLYLKTTCELKSISMNKTEQFLMQTNYN